MRFDNLTLKHLFLLYLFSKKSNKFQFGIYLCKYLCFYKITMLFMRFITMFK